MRQRSETTARKRPRQARSRALVDAVLEAAARVLVERGYEGATTNHIAEVAGVSIGSIYQYFPNKEALVRALLERHVENAVALRPEGLDEEALDLRSRFRMSIEWFLDVHRADPELHRVLTSLAPDVVGSDLLRSFEESARLRIRTVLETHAPELRSKDLDTASFIVATCLESLTHGAVLHHPDMLKAPALADEMTELLVRYLEA